MYWKHSYCAQLVNHTSGSFWAIKTLVFFHWAVQVLNKMMHTIHSYSAELCNMLSWLWKPEAVITRSKMHPQPRQRFSLLFVKISQPHYYMCNGYSYFQSNYLFQSVLPKTNYRMHGSSHAVTKTSCFDTQVPVSSEQFNQARDIYCLEEVMGRNPQFQEH